ncbi:MAG: hypothetical protein AAGA81_16685, partial [Acidobacteriota bacterium]
MTNLYVRRAADRSYAPRESVETGKKDSERERSKRGRRGRWPLTILAANRDFVGLPDARTAGGSKPCRPS